MSDAELGPQSESINERRVALIRQLSILRDTIEGLSEGYRLEFPVNWLQSGGDTNITDAFWTILELIELAVDPDSAEIRHEEPGSAYLQDAQERLRGIADTGQSIPDLALIYNKLFAITIAALPIIQHDEG